MAECFDVDIDAEKDLYVFVGDSPNDVPMFRFFPNAVGTANVRKFERDLAVEPAYVTKRDAGAGFAEVAETLIAGRIA